MLAATEAAGEGINLQFCWFMINFDIPWSPIRLEQRMGRIHRYGQEYDCLILNFVAVNTNEGRVLAKLLERLREIRNELGTDQVFDVVGEIFPGNLLEKLFRDLYIRKTNVPDIEARIVRDMNPLRFRAITESTLEGLARRELNLASIVGKSVEARAKTRSGSGGGLLRSGRTRGGNSAPVARQGHARVPDRQAAARPDHSGLEAGAPVRAPGREYARIVFDKALLPSDPTLEWVTPGHPLFEVVREDVLERVADHLRRGAVYFDLQRTQPAQLDVFAASVKDGNGSTLHRRLFVIEIGLGGGMTVRQPTVFLDGMVPAPAGTPAPVDGHSCDRSEVERILLEQALQPFLAEMAGGDKRQIETIRRHVEISLDALIDRQNRQLADLLDRQIQGQTIPGLDGLISQAESPSRPAQRPARAPAPGARARAALHHHRHRSPGQGLGPAPSRARHASARTDGRGRGHRADRGQVRDSPRGSTRGCRVESVETQNRGFDLISRRPHPEDPATAIEVRFIEVKGRAGVGQISLTANEYKTAQRLKGDYWLYTVFNCGGKPELHLVQDPARLGWEVVMQVEHYQIGADVIRKEPGYNEGAFKIRLVPFLRHRFPCGLRLIRDLNGQDRAVR